MKKADEIFIIDRIEGGFAVAYSESGEKRDFSLAMLPPDISPGDALNISGPAPKFEKKNTDDRRRRLSSRTKNARKRSEGKK
ncbi:MAG: DUF3006 domain-containing protein [Ruminococcus sp.]|nr:DUF3006 domain-containing protein [Ruminococcus sp.]